MKVGDKIKFVRNTQNSKGVTLGKIYAVTSMYGIDPYIVNDKGEEVWYTARQFDVVTEDDILFDDIKRAKNLIGKRVRNVITGYYFIPDSFGVSTPYTRDIEQENIVYLESHDSIAPLKDIVEVTNVIKLTDDYDAIVEKDIVKVGCQNIPIEKVKEIIELWKSLNQ